MRSLNAFFTYYVKIRRPTAPFDFHIIREMTRPAGDSVTGGLAGRLEVRRPKLPRLDDHV